MPMGANSAASSTPSGHPAYAECGDDVCPKHMEEGSLDFRRKRTRCLCLACAEELSEEAEKATRLAMLDGAAMVEAFR